MDPMEDSISDGLVVRPENVGVAVLHEKKKERMLLQTGFEFEPGSVLFNARDGQVKSGRQLYASSIWRHYPKLSIVHGCGWRRQIPRIMCERR